MAVDYAAVLAGLKTALAAQDVVAEADTPTAPLPSVVVLPPGVDRFLQTNEGWNGELRSIWALGLYSKPTFPDACDLLERVLQALADDHTLGGTVETAVPQRADIPRREEPKANNTVYYRRELLLEVEHHIGGD